ncbi:MAG: polyprenyl synthetase family protein [Acidobacteriota bacterium]
MQMFTAAKKGIDLRLTAKNFFGLIAPELELVEAEYERQVNSNIQVVNFLGEYVRASGGKRVRPALLLLAVYAAGGIGKDPSAVRMATVMEMLHTATLVHDDIIDNAGLRRNRESVNARFGNQTAVLMGDWLYMNAFEASLKERSLEILDILTRLTRQMTEGELIQLTLIGKVDLTHDEYFDIVRRKTAYLFSGCCEIGAILGQIDQSGRAGLRNFGMNLGVAFQLADDLLDITADESSLGKSAGADLIEGKVTIPLILLIEQDDSVRAIVQKIFETGEFPAELRADILGRMRTRGIIDQVRSIAAEYAGTSRKNLEVLPETEYSRALDAIPEFVIERQN